MSSAAMIKRIEDLDDASEAIERYVTNPLVSRQIDSIVKERLGQRLVDEMSDIELIIDALVSVTYPENEHFGSKESQTPLQTSYRLKYRQGTYAEISSAYKDDDKAELGRLVYERLLHPYFADRKEVLEKILRNEVEQEFLQA